MAASNVKLGHRKAGTPNPMTAAGKVEHSLVAQTIEEMIGPRLTTEVCVPLLCIDFFSMPILHSGANSADAG